MVGQPKHRRTWWLAFLDRTNVTVTTLTAVFLLARHSSGVAYFCSGAVMCSLTAKLVKRVIRQPRPTHPPQRKVSYGMPSTHSAAISFFATYIPLACIYDPTDAFFPIDSIWRAITPTVVVVGATLIASSRVWLGHHTWPQVACGCLYGMSFASLWFMSWTNGINQYGFLADDILLSYIGQVR